MKRLLVRVTSQSRRGVIFRHTRGTQTCQEMWIKGSVHSQCKVDPPSPERAITSFIHMPVLRSQLQVPRHIRYRWLQCISLDADLAMSRDIYSEDRAKKFIRQLQGVIPVIEETLKQADEVKTVANYIKMAPDAFSHRKRTGLYTVTGRCTEAERDFLCSR